MKAGDLAKRPPVILINKASIRDAARVMAEKNVGLVVIVDPLDYSHIIGVVSERDIVKAVALNINPLEPVEKIMSTPVITADVEEPIQNVARKMRVFNVRHIVVTKEGRLYGVISIRDLIREREVLKSLAEYEEPVEIFPSGD
ncbi:putative signal-transduction protein with CBS domains [Pyrobaculum islandicum DSM 4184]|uniref:Signal-transduction protein with CBS domains n=1 Tax=Pyrobaculum islandicum (strain DSM 4184 / JCM 9189 / GEO3) TaxID=384616 RepID=A1RR53_PYRIL|nr:CBS domain-containing protein [Pyrobaculum islandicum]ABL87435.1 putative signal-transduction protein with CBS domains [Pyrobaculum islandicum DSM 4184]